ncbi:MAG: flagellin FliC, partial [Betaproteobacteria bacterium]|nr:flagellin FliC [Betaproteobacteria bacterium]
MYVLGTNIASISAQRFLQSAQTRLSERVERLSSGTRINRAQDDAAGLGISERLKSQVLSIGA